MRFLNVLCAAALLTFVQDAHAKPIAAAEGPEVKIVLTDDPCSLPEVKNLPYAATWTEGGKIIPGCWGAHPQMAVVMSYWADHTVAIIPNHSLHLLNQI